MTHHAGKDEIESERIGGLIGAIPQKCWNNARRAILELDAYDGASYIEGIAVLDIAGLLIEHGWVCRADGVVIDPTLPRGVLAYFPGLEFPGRDSIQAFLACEASGIEPDQPFFFAYGYGGNKSPSYAGAWKQAWAYRDLLFAGHRPAE